jgi:chromosome segregation protein
MLLKKLDIYGFKSFADRISIEFDKGITAIVGPNGCGKSNVADAVRWVLGEQSAKLLRGSKMEDIIFSGTQLRKPLGFAEVSLTLDNTDAQLPLDFSEITITRRVYRSGESEYYINRSLCRLKDIHELFMDTGIGKEGYSIIGQGRIDEILSNRSEDRRNVFEEAAGITKYKYRRDETLKRLEKTHDNLIRTDDVLNELEQQLHPLEEQSKTAREYLKIRDQLKFLEINHFIMQYQKNSEKIGELKRHIGLLEKDIHNHKMMLADIETQENNTKERLIVLDNSTKELADKRHLLLQQIERDNGQIGILNEKIQQLSRENKRINNEVETETFQKKVKMEQHSSLIDQFNKSETRLTEILNQVAKLDNQLKDINAFLTDGQQVMEQEKTNIIESLNKLAQSKSELTRYDILKENFCNRKSELSKLIKNQSDALIDLCKQKKLISHNIQVFDSKRNDLAYKREQQYHSLQSDIQRLQDIEKQNQRCYQIMEGKKSRLHLLEEMKNGYEGFSKSVKHVLRSCSQNQYLKSKICGVVAELIQVPQEYEICIETALGNSMQFVVTEKETDAKTIIDYLRTHQYGRATFLPISSIRSRSLSPYERGVLSMSGCVDVASELITFDTKYKCIFENLLGRVVIAESLEYAIPMARKFEYAFRIVTLDGDVINPGGSLTGGSYTNKGINILSRNREISELREAIKQITNDLTHGQQMKNHLLQCYNEKKQLVDQLDKEIHSIDIDKASENEKLQNIHFEYQRVEKELKSLTNEQEIIEKDLTDIIKIIETLNKEIIHLENINADMQSKIKIAESDLKEKINLKEKIEQENTGLKIEMAALKRECHSLSEKIKQLSEDITFLENSIQKKEEQVEQNTQNKTFYNKDISNFEESIRIKRGKIQSIELSVNSNQKEKKEKDNLLRNLQHQIKEITETLDAINAQKYRFEVQLSRIDLEHETLQNAIWNEYEISYQHALEFKDETLSFQYVTEHINTLKKSIHDLGDVNINAIDEYARVKERYDFLTEQKNDLLRAQNDLKNIIRDITKTMRERFTKEFEIIDKHFNDVFSQLFGGGKAQLILDNQDDVLNCGIEIIAQPPGKKLQNLSLLSGGEKALTAIAILFAILRRKPTPFCVLDEIEAALDESNVNNFGNFLKKFSKNTQFVIITHRKGTMEVSDILYGISMEEKGVSKMVSVRLEDKAS